MRTATPTNDNLGGQTREESAPESRRRRDGECDREDCLRVSGAVSVHGLAKVTEETGCTARR